MVGQLVFIVAVKEGELRFFLVFRRWGLVIAFLCQLLFQAAFTITVHHGFIPVLAKIFSDVLFLCVILSHYHHLAKGLQQDAYAGYYGDKLFQSRFWAINSAK